MTPTTRIVAAGTCMAVGLLLSGCGGDKANEQYQDAPRSGLDNGTALVITMPDGFNNVATKCIQGTGIRVAVVFHNDSSYGSVSMVADPTCKP